MLWVAGYSPGELVELSFNDSLKTELFADENGFIFPSSNIPLPVIALPYMDMRLTVTGKTLQNGELVDSKDNGMKPLSYGVSTDKLNDEQCKPTSRIVGVYAITDDITKKQLSNNPVQVTLNTNIIHTGKIVDGKVVRQIDKSTKNCTIHGER